MVCRTFFNELKEKYFKTALLILGEKAYSICYKGTQTQATYLCIVIITVTQSYGHKKELPQLQEPSFQVGSGSPTLTNWKPITKISYVLEISFGR